MVAMRAAYSLKDLQRILEQEKGRYPFFCVLLYTPGNGINATLHDYVRSHWDYLNAMTGYTCLLVALEDRDEPTLHIDRFSPAVVYEIARYFGADVDMIPGMILFTQSTSGRHTLIVRLSRALKPSKDVLDEDITAMFQSLQVVIDACSGKTPKGRYDCLSRGLRKAWSQPLSWAPPQPVPVGERIVPALAATATILDAVVKISTLLQNLRLGV